MTEPMLSEKKMNKVYIKNKDDSIVIELLSSADDPHNTTINLYAKDELLFTESINNYLRSKASMLIDGSKIENTKFAQYYLVTDKINYCNMFIDSMEGIFKYQLSCDNNLLGIGNVSVLVRELIYDIFIRLLRDMLSNIAKITNTL